MPRARAAEKLFKDILKIDKVEVLVNLTKDQIIEKLNEIEAESTEFQSANKDRQATNAVFINWVGFNMQPENYYNQFSSNLFCLTRTGEFIPILEHLLKIADKSERTQIVFFGD